MIVIMMKVGFTSMLWFHVDGHKFTSLSSSLKKKSEYIFLHPSKMNAPQHQQPHPHTVEQRLRMRPDEVPDSETVKQ